MKASIASSTSNQSHTSAQQVDHASVVIFLLCPISLIYRAIVSYRFIVCSTADFNDKAGNSKATAAIWYTRDYKSKNGSKHTRATHSYTCAVIKFMSELALVRDHKLTPLARFFLGRCGAPPVEWKIAEDAKAPEGWTSWGLDNSAGNLGGCGNGWNGYAHFREKGQLAARMTGSGRATVKYKDCWGEGYAGLYLNGILMDKSPANTAETRTFRCLQA